MKPYLSVFAFATLLFSSLVAYNQSNYECQLAEPLPIPFTTTGYFEDNFYILSPESSGIYIIETCGLNSCDTRLWLYSSCPSMLDGDNSTLIAQNDDGCGLQSRIQANLIAGNSYILRVGDFATACNVPINFSVYAFETIPGCTNSGADNYNPEANFDDGSCIFYGCTDETAFNYDWSATVDDGSCITCNAPGAQPASLYLCTFSNALQVELSILDSNGDLVAYLSGATGGAIQYLDICLEPGECYSAVMHNNTGPLGWYNGYFWVNTGGFQLVNAGLQPGTQTQIIQFSIDGTCGASFGCTNPQASNFDPSAAFDDGSCIIEGCTDTSAINYNSSANSDDGSCEYCTDGILATLYVCTFSNGNQVELQIVDDSGQEVIFVEQLGNVAIEYMTICLQPGTCYTVNMINNTGPFGWYNGYYWINVNGAQISNGSLPSGTAMASTIFSIDGTCGPVVIGGCTDPSASNYDATATYNDGSCVYPIYGCTDPAALNYDVYATENYGCIYAESCLQNLVVFNLGGSTWESEMWFDMFDENGLWVAGSGAGTSYACLGDGCYYIQLYDSFGDGWDNGALSISVNGATASTFTMFSGSLLEVNFGINTSGCSPQVQGCTDPNALNFNPLASFDDGSCISASDCDQEWLVMTVVTQMWGSEISWDLINSSGEVVWSGDNYTSWSSETVYGCLPSDCYELVLNDSWGDGWNGAYYEIYGANTYSFGTLNYGSMSIDAVGVGMPCSDSFGCMDAEAMNYNPSAIYDDGSCMYNDNNGEGMIAGSETVNVTAYPVPMGSELILELTNLNNDENTQIRILSVDGRVVFNQEIQALDTLYRLSIPTNDFAAGAYIIHVQNGQDISTKSVLKF